MKVYTFGDAEKPAVLLLPGTCCHWESNFGQIIPLLASDFRVLCVSYDGFDETERTEFPTMLEETAKIEDWIRANCGGHIRAAYGCSLGGSFVGLLAARGSCAARHAQTAAATTIRSAATGTRGVRSTPNTATRRGIGAIRPDGGSVVGLACPASGGGTFPAPGKVPKSAPKPRSWNPFRSTSEVSVGRGLNVVSASVLRRDDTTFKAPCKILQTCGTCYNNCPVCGTRLGYTPSCQPIPVHFVAANRDTSSKPPRFIRHWRRFGDFQKPWFLAAFFGYFLSLVKESDSPKAK